MTNLRQATRVNENTDKHKETNNNNQTAVWSQIQG